MTNTRLPIFTDRGVVKLFWAWIAYSIITICSFQFGPYYYHNSTGQLVWLYLFLFCAHVAIILGFVYQMRRPLRPSADWAFLERHLNKLPFLALVAVLLELFLRLLIYKGAYDLADARSAWHDAGGSLYSHLILYCSSITLPVLALACSRWRQFSLIQKSCLAACVGGEFVFTIMGGTRHGAFVVAVIFAFLFLTQFSARFKFWAKFLVLNVSVIFVLGFLVYSSVVMMQRYDMDVRDVSIEQLARKQGRLGNVLNPDHLLVTSAIPAYLKPALVMGTYYFGHGYQALADALSLQQRFPSMGIGHSLFLTRSSFKLGLYQITSKSYAVRLNNELGYNIPQTWMTGYAWLASDLTFYGVIPLLFFLARALCLAWRCFAAFRDLYAALALVWLLNIFIQFPLLFPGQDYFPLLLIYTSIGLFLRQQQRAQR